MKKEVTKQRPISMTDSLYESVLKKAEEVGMNFSAYVRYILIQSMKGDEK